MQEPSCKEEIADTPASRLILPKCDLHVVSSDKRSDRMSINYSSCLSVTTVVVFVGARTSFHRHQSVYLLRGFARKAHHSISARGQSTESDRHFDTVTSLQGIFCGRKPRSSFAIWHASARTILHPFHCHGTV
jgi:hypothetical protein